MDAVETRLARITWNSKMWRQPTGREEKREQGTFVSEYGFGHEEWLGRTEWRIGKWQYSFIQGVNRSRSTIRGQRFRLILYSIDGSGQRWYVGSVDAEVLSDIHASEGVASFSRRGFVSEMRREVLAVGGDPT